VESVVIPEAQDVPEQVREILTRLLARPISHAEDSEAPLRELGLTSLRMIQLLGELESTFAVPIADDEVIPSNFGTLGSLTAYVKRKLGGSP
jgi:acyl carrier protein